MTRDVIEQRSSSDLPHLGESAPVGGYRYRRAEDSWWWSDEAYAMYGFRPGEVVPTSALLKAHRHPDDWALIEYVTTVEFPRTGNYCFRYKIIDAQRRVRSVLSVGRADHDADGTVIGWSGYLVDLTQSEKQVVAGAVAGAMEVSLEQRMVIEQAKGALTATFGLSADDAFALLSTRSQLLNVKVRELAARLLDTLHEREPDASLRDPRAAISAVLALE